MHRTIYNMPLPRRANTWFPSPQMVDGRTLRHNQILSDG